MKKLLIMVLLAASFQVYAKSADYFCKSWTTEIELNLTDDDRTSMWLEDRHYGFLSHGFVTSIEKVGDNSTYHFFPNRLVSLDLTFKTKDTENLPDKMFGLMVLKDGLSTFHDTLKCTKQ